MAIMRYNIMHDSLISGMVAAKPVSGAYCERFGS